MKKWVVLSLFLYSLHAGAAEFIYPSAFQGTQKEQQTVLSYIQNHCNSQYREENMSYQECEFAEITSFKTMLAMSKVQSLQDEENWYRTHKDHPSNSWNRGNRVTKKYIYSYRELLKQHDSRFRRY